MREAGERSIQSSLRLQRKAQELCEEMEEVTPAHGIPTTQLSDEDSMVIAVTHAIESAKH